MGKEKRIARVITLMPVCILLLLELLLRPWFWTEQVINWTKIVLLVLAIIPVPFYYMSMFPGSRTSKWLVSMQEFYIPIYYAFFLLLFSLNRDIIPQIPRFDMSTMGVALALFALGLTYYMQRKKPENAEALEALNKKFLKAEKIIDTFLEESQKLGERLAAIQKEEKGKR